MRIGIYATFYRSHAARSSLYTSVFQRRHTSMGAGIHDVGRNKAIQARSARWRFRRVHDEFAGNASSRYRSNRLIPAYFEMCIKMSAASGNEAVSLTLMYNDERSGVGMQNATLHRRAESG